MKYNEYYGVVHPNARQWDATAFGAVPIAAHLGVATPYMGEVTVFTNCITHQLIISSASCYVAVSS